MLLLLLFLCLEVYLVYVVLRAQWPIMVSLARLLIVVGGMFALTSFTIIFLLAEKQVSRLSFATTHPIIHIHPPFPYHSISHQPQTTQTKRIANLTHPTPPAAVIAKFPAVGGCSEEELRAVRMHSL